MASKNLEQELDPHDCRLQAFRLGAKFALKAEVIPRQSKMVFHHQEDPHDDIRDALAPLSREPKQQFVNGKWCCSCIIHHQVKVDPPD